jgi:G patch domain-containing protein 1
LLAKSKKPGFKKSGGFGTGVLNDTGSDDEDDEAIMGPRISYNRIIGGDKIKPKKKGGLMASAAAQKPLTFTSSSAKKLEQRSSTLSGFRKCHDGRLPLDGFVLTSTPLVVPMESKYSPPAVPEGWKSSHLSASNSTQTGKEWQSTADAAKASTLDPKSRAQLLGEQQLPGKSVFDFISPAARDKLAAASGRSDLPQALGEKAPDGYQPSETEARRSMWDLVPKLDKATAEAALQRGRSGFMPYAEDEAKRNRYVAFLELKARITSTLPAKLIGMTTDEWSNELQEFAKAAEVFRPISSLMASRFTSSASSGPRLASDAPDQPVEKEDDPAEKAAKLGMFGPGHTRSRAQFFPTRLLCKRFNVKPPANVDPGSADAEDVGASGSGTKDLVSQASLDRMAREANWAGMAGGKGFVSGGIEGGDDDVAHSTRQAPEQVDAEKNEALEAERPGEDIFKAIFGSDDEDE